MDTLCDLFDAVGCLSELLGRGAEKTEELCLLVATVESVSQSVRSFAGDLAPEERDAVFNSNQVFHQLARQLRQCDEVVSKHKRFRLCTGPQRQELGNAEPLISSFKRGLAQAAQEGMEVLGGKLGTVGAAILRLPEDELRVIRQVSTELSRLVPQLNLAITVYATQRGQKRRAPESRAPTPPPLQVPRREPSLAGDAAGGPALVTDQGAEVELPLRLQLVSDAGFAQACQLHVFTAKELRPVSAMSSSSLESAACGASNDSGRRLVFGRQELRDKVPKTFTLPTTVAGVAPQPLQRFISRDMFVFEVPLEQPAETPPDTLEMATLALGPAEDLGGATLAWGNGGSQPARPLSPPLASASGLSVNGLHLREVGETRWTWMPKDSKVELRDGDRLALLLESPPGSSTPGPPRDLTSTEATCLLGLELKRA